MMPGIIVDGLLARNGWIGFNVKSRLVIVEAEKHTTVDTTDMFRE